MVVVVVAHRVAMRAARAKAAASAWCVAPAEAAAAPEGALTALSLQASALMGVALRVAARLEPGRLQVPASV